MAVSLIKGLPIPPIYTYRNSENQLEILDGQQRVISLFLYYHGKIVGSERNSYFDCQDLEINDDNFLNALEQTKRVRNCTYIMNVDGCDYDISYQKLPKKLQRKVDYTPITVIEIKIESEENRDKILHRIFANLNREGERLSNQELRNGIYPCEFYSMLTDVNKNNKKWRKIYGAIDKKGKDIELLLRLCALRYFVDFSEKSQDLFSVSKYDNAFLDEFSELAIGFDSGKCTEYRKSLENYINHFELSGTYKKITILESLYIVLEKTDIDCVITLEVCDALSRADGFAEASKQGTMSVSNMKRRWKIAYEQLSKYVE